MSPDINGIAPIMGAFFIVKISIALKKGIIYNIYKLINRDVNVESLQGKSLITIPIIINAGFLHRRPKGNR